MRESADTRSVLPPVALVLLASTLFVGASLARSGWDCSSFIHAGDYFVDNHLTPSPITVLPHSVGYDGQMYYRLALDPLTDKRTAYGVTLDDAAFRMQRIGYPLIVWLVSLGQPALVPAALIIVNLLGITIVAYLGARIAAALNCPAWAGIMLAYPGFFVTLSRDTAEITATAFALAAVLCLLEAREWLGILLACCAVLCRETTLLYMSGFGLIAAWRCWRSGHFLSLDWLKFTLPLVVFIAWQQVLTAHWGETPKSGGQADLDWPFLGALGMLRDTLIARQHIFPKLWLDLIARFIAVGSAAVILVCVIQVAFAVRPSRAPSGLKVSWALYTCLFACLSLKIWTSPLDFLRAFTDCYMAGMIVLIGARFTLPERSGRATRGTGTAALQPQGADRLRCLANSGDRA